MFGRPAAKHGRRAFSVAAAALLALLLALVSGCGGSTTTPADTSAPTTSSPSQTSETTPPALPRSIPTKLRVPAINAESSLIQLGLNPDQTVQVPSVHTPQQAGWYDQSPTPGELGPAVILGHVDGDGMEGIFFHLHELKPGDQIFVDRQDGKTATFVVNQVDSVPKSDFPTDKVYGNTPDAELRLITCGGVFDKSAHSYENNIIVYATLKP